MNPHLHVALVNEHVADLHRIAAETRRVPHRQDGETGARRGIAAIVHLLKAVGGGS